MADIDTMPTVAILGRKRYKIGIVTMPSGNPAIALNHVGTERPSPSVEDFRPGTVVLEFTSNEAVRAFFRDIEPLRHVDVKDQALERFKSEQADTLSDA